MNCWVYPRGCGGTTSCLLCLIYVHGLSPRVRGNRFRRSTSKSNGRSIPAGAGEPQMWGFFMVFYGVYPRGCGGTRLPSLAESRALGLSPRVRGNQGRGDQSNDIHRSIPAGAGEPSACSCAHATSQVYPRGCGGTSKTPSRSACCRGLSPRVRGNPA